MIFTWTPLISADSFTGIFTDITTAGTGIIAAAVIILGVFFIVRAISRWLKSGLDFSQNLI